MNPIIRLDEREILQILDGLIKRVEAAECIEHAIVTVSRKLAADENAVLAWEPIPLGVYGNGVPEMVRSSWVFILRSRSVTGAERHPNSHQRMASYRGSGDMQVDFRGQGQPYDGKSWRSNLLSSDPASKLEQRWVSIPPGTWHQAVTGDDHWIVVSFQTAGERDLIEERPDPDDSAATRMRTYLE